MTIHFWRDMKSTPETYTITFTYVSSLIIKERGAGMIKVKNTGGKVLALHAAKLALINDYLSPPNISRSDLSAQSHDQALTLSVVPNQENIKIRNKRKHFPSLLLILILLSIQINMNKNISIHILFFN